MRAEERIREYLIEHGPSTWAEIQEGTGLSKGSLANHLTNGDSFSSTATTNTLYSPRNAPVRHVRYEHVIRTMLRDMNTLMRYYERDKMRNGQQEAEAQAQINLNNHMAKFNKAMERAEK